MLAAIGRHYGWPRAELETLTGPDMRFWLGCVGAYNQARSE
jgi:hypothetical protein